MKRTALLLHLVGRLPGPDDHFANAAHRLRIARHDRERPDIVQHILSHHRLGANPGIGEGDILRHLRAQVMADHQHVEVFLDRVHGVGPRGVRGRRNHVRETGDPDDVRGVAAARPFRVIGVDRALADRGERCFRGIPPR